MLKNYIYGSWVPSANQDFTPVINPATTEVIAQCPTGHLEDVNAAIESAHKAFQTWKNIPVIDRIQYLFKIKQILDDNLNEIAACVTKEHGKTLAEARASTRRGIQMVETATSMTSFQMGEFLEDVALGIDCRTIRRPLGVFAGIAPSNFPAMVPFWFWPFAIASGNTFVLKPSERVPLTQKLIFELIEKAKLPPGVLNLINGDKTVVYGLCSHPLVKGTCFVGSTPVAKHVYTLSSSHFKRCQSLGGAKNFMVVAPDAVMEKSAATALDSILGCAGERCLAGSVVICIGDKTYNAIKEKLIPLAKDYSIGDGMDPNVMMGPVISSEAKNRIINLIQSGIDEGATLYLDGRKEVDHLKGYFLRPSVIGDVTPKMKIAQEEIFGPVACLAKVNSLDEAIAWINSCSFANTTTLFTTQGAVARKFCNEVDPSMIGINIGVPAPMSFFSFGGTKDSFYGDIKAHGKASVEFFTDLKIVTERWHSDANVWQS